MAVYREPGESDVYLPQKERRPTRKPWPDGRLAARLLMVFQAPISIGLLVDSYTPGGNHAGLLTGLGAVSCGFAIGAVVYQINKWTE